MVHTGEPLYIPDYRKAQGTGRTEHNTEEDGILRGRARATSGEAEHSTKSVLSVPMKINGHTSGVMQVQSSRLDAYTQEDIELLAGLANVSAVAVRNAQLLEKVAEDAKKLGSALDSTIASLGVAIETRDP